MKKVILEKGRAVTVMIIVKTPGGEDEEDIEDNEDNNNCKELPNTYTIFNPNDTYQQIIDCAVSYLVNKKREVFQLEEPHHYVGMYCHDDCPCEGDGEIEIKA